MRCRAGSCFRSLAAERSGATIVEFAFVAPIFIGLVMFIFDAGFLMFAQSVLRGEVNAVGRASTLENATDESRTAMDQALSDKIRAVVPDGQLEFDRVSFNNYGLAQSRVEPFVDGNNSNDCDNAESFLDLNGNGRHDLDGARAGGGGARDVVIYTVTLRYERLFPVEGLLGLDGTVELEARTLLKNQPFDLQTQPLTALCP
jgi:TadE-like protein